MRTRAGPVPAGVSPDARRRRADARAVVEQGTEHDECTPRAIAQLEVTAQLTIAAPPHLFHAMSSACLRCKDDRMSLVIDCVLIDCLDLDAMTAFWCQALDLEHVWTGPSGGHLLAATDGSGRRLALMPSHSRKAAKNRVHFDLRPDHDQQAEVRRLEGLGARRIDIGQADVTWVVMADPDGNEFCVLRSLVQQEKDLGLNSG